MELPSRKFIIIIIFSMILVFSFSLTIQPVVAVISVRIDGGTAGGTGLAPDDIKVLAQGQTTMPVTFTYTGTRTAGDRSLITEFRCIWLPWGGFTSLAGPYPNSCPSTRADSGPTDMIGVARGSVTNNLRPGTYSFDVQVLNSAGSFRPSQGWTFTIASPARPGDPAIDPSLPPQARTYKANSYNIEATTFNPATGANNQYHTQVSQPTPYKNMYIVFAAYYSRDPLLARPQESDIFASNVGTTFECKWDGATTFIPCGRFNIIEGVYPGWHDVIMRAKNARGVPGFSNSFSWCVGVSTCTFNLMPPAYRAITPLDVRSYISGGQDASFFPGKNETISLKDLKDFPIINVTKGANNQTISLKDLKEFPILNATLSAKDTFLNKTIGTGTNNTNVTDFSPKDAPVNQSSK